VPELRETSAILVQKQGHELLLSPVAVHGYSAYLRFRIRRQEILEPKERWENQIRTFELTPGAEVNWNQINAYLRRMGRDGWRVSGFQFGHSRVAVAFTRLLTE
jgi:hypothetical protein